jgi:hypothetical protein
MNCLTLAKKRFIASVARLCCEPHPNYSSSWLCARDLEVTPRCQTEKKCSIYVCTLYSTYVRWGGGSKFEFKLHKAVPYNS